MNQRIQHMSVSEVKWRQDSQSWRKWNEVSNHLTKPGLCYSYDCNFSGWGHLHSSNIEVGLSKLFSAPSIGLWPSNPIIIQYQIIAEKFYQSFLFAEPWSMNHSLTKLEPPPLCPQLASTDQIIPHLHPPNSYMWRYDHLLCLYVNMRNFG